VRRSIREHISRQQLHSDSNVSIHSMNHTHAGAGRAAPPPVANAVAGAAGAAAGATNGVLEHDIYFRFVCVCVCVCDRGAVTVLRTTQTSRNQSFYLSNARSNIGAAPIVPTARQRAANLSYDARVHPRLHLFLSPPFLGLLTTSRPERVV
jgi:hypothetical protein